MKATFISDEFSQDFARCVDFARARGLDAIELRSVEGCAIEAAEDATIRRIDALARRRDIAICGLATFCFKHDYDPISIRQSLDRLDRTVDTACRLGAPWVRIFAFWRRDGLAPAAIRDAVLDAWAVIGTRPVRLLVENGAFSTVGTGSALAALLDAVDQPEIGALWDPANVLNGGWPEDIDEGYRHLDRHVAHIHVKNPHGGPSGAMRFGPLATGLIDWQRHIRLCRDGGFDGYMSLETHWRATADLAGREQLDFPGGHAFSEGGEAATFLSLTELTGMITAATAPSNEAVVHD